MKNLNWLVGSLILVSVANFASPVLAEDEPADADAAADAASAAAEACPQCALLEQLRPRDPTLADYISYGLQLLVEEEEARVAAMSEEERRAYEENLAAHRRWPDSLVENGELLGQDEDLFEHASRAHRRLNERSTAATTESSGSGRLPADHDCTGHGRSGRGR